MKISLTILFMILFLSFNAFGEAAERETRVFNAAHGDLEGLHQALVHMASDDGKVSVLRDSNSIIVVDHPENVIRMEGVFKTLDVPKKEVLIKA
ncbi:MAG: hypothetical protein HQ594_04610, partial [Candidatus Omnitrophica bacterium]|nr:hypothetical protein [Candidatus Omnitrophota bacterium]